MKLIHYLPFYYKDIAEIVELQEVIESEKKIIIERIINTFKQAYILEADTSLPIWEQIYGLTTGDTNTLIQQRRELVLSKMRSLGATTAEQIKRVALAFTNGEIEVIEKYKDYAIEIKFISIVGVVPNINDFKKALAEIIPAHIGYSITYRYNTHGDIENSGATQEQLEKYTHNELYNKKIEGGIF